MKKALVKMGSYTIDRDRGIIIVTSVLAAQRISLHASDTQAQARQRARREALLEKVISRYGDARYGWEIREE